MLSMKKKEKNDLDFDGSTRLAEPRKKLRPLVDESKKRAAAGRRHSSPALEL